MLFPPCLVFLQVFNGVDDPMLLPIIIISATWDADLSARVCRSIIR